LTALTVPPSRKVGERKVLVVAVALALAATSLVIDHSGAKAVTGAITEYPITTSASQPTIITTGPDGNLWFVEEAADKVAKMTTAGVVTEYDVPTASAEPYSIVAGPDGNLWITEIGVGKIARVTTAGVFTEFATPTAGSAPAVITVGPDGNLWFTDETGNKVDKATTAGAIVEYTIPTTFSAPLGITAGPDGKLWFVESNPGKVAKVTTSGAFTEYQSPVSGVFSAQFITAGPDGNLWFNEEGANKVAKVTTAGVFTEYPITTAASGTSFITTGPDGNLWFTESNADKIGTITTAGAVTEYAVPTASSTPAGITTGPDNNLWFVEFDGNNVGKILDAPPSCTAGAVPALTSAVSTQQYSLAGSNGTSWAELGADNLRLYCAATATQQTLLTANADLFTANAGFNQDIGIFVSHNGGTDQLLAWKESGGFAGTFSPNAASAQVVYTMTSGDSYVFKLKWKTNKPAAGATIYAGAGNGPYSPTSLVAQTFPTATPPNFNSSTVQYTLANSNGSTWQNVDATNLFSTITPAAGASAVLTANVDLFTGKAGFNQDIGIFVSDNAGPDTLVTWKESGGFAGTFSPNAAFLKAIYPVVASHTYVFKLKWKTNKPAAGATIYAGAGNSPYSPTSIRVSLFTGDTFSTSSTIQYHLTGSNGATWQPIDAATNDTVLQGVNTNSVIGANVDLFTGNAGYNQDIAIFVSDNGGADVLLAWKESGGFAGTFSPNAAFVQTTLQMTAGHTYVFTLKWKTNKPAAAATIYAAAGGPAPYSNTWLTVEPTDY
jgi:virginiamycin B lyase